MKESRNTVVSILTSSTKWGPRDEVRLTKFCSGPAPQLGDGITIYLDMCEGLGSISRTFKTLRNLFSQYFILAWLVAAQLKPSVKTFSGSLYSIMESVGEAVSL